MAPTDASDGKIEITIQLALFGIITMVGKCHHVVLDTLVIITTIEKCEIYFNTNWFQNEKDQTLTTNCEKILMWNDMFLRWD